MSIEMQNLTYQYPRMNVPVLCEIDLQIAQGEFIVITGASGSGKTTLLRCCNGLIPYFYGGRLSGKLVIHGKNVYTTPTRELATEVGFVFQNPQNQLISATVEREIAFGLENLMIPPKDIRKYVDEILHRFRIENLRHRPPHSLSGGEQQKVAIAAVVAMKPSILIMDEPTANLDPISAADIIHLTKELNHQLNLTVIIVEHRLELILPLCSRLIVLNRGRKVIDLPPKKAIELDKLYEMNIGLPQISLLFRRIKDDLDFRVKNTPLTVNEAISYLQQLIGAKISK
ncbi:MAG: energy-coupling factor ABC transporter ATP-binding protein [Candidatus Heimdallarchaeota archaeon]